MNSRDWQRPVPASTKTEGKIRTTKLVSRKVESDQGGLMSYGTCHTLPPVFLLSSWFFLWRTNVKQRCRCTSVPKTHNSLRCSVVGVVQSSMKIVVCRSQTPRVTHFFSWWAQFYQVVLCQAPILTVFGTLELGVLTCDSELEAAQWHPIDRFPSSFFFLDKLQ